MPWRHQGAALFLLLLSLLLGGAGLFLYSVAPPRRTVVEAEAVFGVLRDARQALLAHAMTYAERNPGRMGVLPCPQRNTTSWLPSGSSAGTCGARYLDAIGLLPWRSLGLSPPPFCVLYLVSGSFKTSPAAYMLNEDSPGSLHLYQDSGHELTGAAPRRRAAALLLAPGGAGRLDTDCRDFDAAHWPGLLLRSAGLDSALRLAAPQPGAGAGDLALALGDGEIFTALQRHGAFATRLYDPDTPDNLARLATECLLRFLEAHEERLPWPAPLAVEDARRNESYDDWLPPRPPGADAPALFGRLPNRIDDSLAAMGSPPGERLLTSCEAFARRTSEARRLWDNWKDHLYYAVAGSRQPDAPPPADCADCIGLRGAPTPAYVAVLLYAGSPLPGQDRLSRRQAGDYLEGLNREAAERGGEPRLTLEARAAGEDFNDVLYCIRPAGADPHPRVLPCPAL